MPSPSLPTPPLVPAGGPLGAAGDNGTDITAIRRPTCDFRDVCGTHDGGRFAISIDFPTRRRPLLTAAAPLTPAGAGIHC